jgi:hypothetical protein
MLVLGRPCSGGREDLLSVYHLLCLFEARADRGRHAVLFRGRVVQPVLGHFLHPHPSHSESARCEHALRLPRVQHPPTVPAWIGWARTYRIVPTGETKVRVRPSLT